MATYIALLPVAFLFIALASVGALTQHIHAELALDLEASRIISTLVVTGRPTNCTCADPQHCKPVVGERDKEFFGFIWPASKNFRQFNWTRLSSIAWLEDPELVCLAHSHAARVILNSGDVKDCLQPGAGALRLSWVATHVQRVLDLGLDGINFDHEAPMRPGDSSVRAYAHLVALTARVIKAVSPGAQVSVDVPWSPFDVDGRNYDWPALTAAADLLFVMAYDTQSQIWGRCVASANSPLPLIARGLQQWLDLGTPPGKMVLGLPWYGYDYPCVSLLQPPHAPAAAAAAVPTPTAAAAARQLHGTAAADTAVRSTAGALAPRQQQQQELRGGWRADGGPAASSQIPVCLLRPVPFTGALCSDAAGWQHPFMDLLHLLDTEDSVTEVMWDELGSASTFTYFNKQDNLPHQVWFDTPQSLLPHYQLAHRLGLRGIGCWNLEMLYSTDPGADKPDARAAMWQAVEDGFFA
ncbi:glycoside hydrolase superfamily [Haematococcus lacustris]